jgi:hypothetical protein
MVLEWKPIKKSPDLTKTLAKLLAYETSPNIAQDILDRKDGEEELVKIGYDVERKHKLDKASRKDWEEGSNGRWISRCRSESPRTTRSTAPRTSNTRW